MTFQKFDYHACNKKGFINSAFFIAMSSILIFGLLNASSFGI